MHRIERKASVENYSTNQSFVTKLIQTKAQHILLRDGRLFITRQNAKLPDVWKGLISYNIHCVPVLNKDNTLHGFLDILDIAEFANKHFAIETLEQSHQFMPMTTREEDYANKKVKDVMKHSRKALFSSLRDGQSALFALELLAKERNLNRVAVVTDEGALVHIVTESQLVRFLYEHIDEIGTVVEKPAELVCLPFSEVHTIRTDQVAKEAFEKMVHQHVGGIGVLNDSGELIDNISLTDLKAIAADGSLFRRLYQSVEYLLKKVDKEGYERPSTVVTATKDESLRSIMKKMLDNKIHRVFVVDTEHKPLGVIAMKDVLLEIWNGI